MEIYPTRSIVDFVEGEELMDCLGQWTQERAVKELYSLSSNSFFLEI